MSDAARIRRDDGIAVGDPIGWIEPLEFVQTVFPIRWNIHACRVAENLHEENAAALAIGAPADDGGTLRVPDRPIDIDPDRHAIAQFYGDILHQQDIARERHGAVTLH